jgi:glucosamine-6-phosphate deaminase
VGRIGSFRVDRLAVEIHPDKRELGRAAAARAVRLIADALARRGRARIVVGTGPSQNEVIGALVEAALDWRRIEVFHMDEYVGIPASHPASFRRWLREHVADRVGPARVHYIEGDAAETAAECRRYAALLAEAPVDICFIGFGENGHIAFNDPHEADFSDPAAVKVVTLDERCRAQQVGEGHFPDVAAVPARAITLTCPALMSAEHLVCSVPDRRKAEAVRRALEGPVTERCPASVVRRHADAALFLEPESAAELTAPLDREGPVSL